MARRRESPWIRLMPAMSIEETGLDPFLYGGVLSPHGAPSPGKEMWNTTARSKVKAENAVAKDAHAHHTKLPAAPVYPKCQHEEKTRFGNSSDLVHVEVKGLESLTQHVHHSKAERRRSKKGKGVNPDNSFFKASKDGNVSLLMAEGGACVQELGSIGSFTDEETMSDRPDNNTFAKQMDASSALTTEEVVGSLQKKKEAWKVVEEVGSTPALQSLNASDSGLCTLESLGETSEGVALLQSSHDADAGVGDSHKEASPSVAPRKMDARSRWKRATHSVKFVNHMAANIRSASTDLIEDKALDEMLQQHATQDDAGGVGAAAFEGAKTVARSRSKGRTGMEGLLVRQDRGFITFFQDFYVACLKMPIGNFLVGVFLAPLALGLLFTPLYLLDVDGLSFNGVVPEDATTSPLVSASQRCLAFLNIFLYALSLSTTFGGAPVAARSPFCLLVANMNTLMAQFLFVFLSGAVFARMSQPSYPIRCSKKAIIKTDDLLPVLGLEQQEKYKALAVRLVLTGPSPCELVDAKICLTFRIFVTLPSGSVFCSTQELEVVRPEVSYLRYGLMVRHIIDKKSPVYGHTMESLYQGDASFSLTVMGMERTSMQPVFHLEDYFVCDDDVIWEGDYEDFIHINDRGQRVLDHSQIDLLKPVKAAAIVSQAVTRMKNLSHQKQKGQVEECVEADSSKEVRQTPHPLWPRNWLNIQKRKLLKSKSTSFTRAYC